MTPSLRFELTNSYQKYRNLEAQEIDTLKDNNFPFPVENIPRTPKIPSDPVAPIYSVSITFCFAPFSDIRVQQFELLQ